MKEQLHYLYNSSIVSDSGYHIVNIVFLCEYESGKAVASSLDEVESVYWMTSAQIYDHSNAPVYLKESIKRAESLIDRII
ncbi:hypothetical protein J2Z23_002612 [Lederbergia galactosidilyticus]|nr:hypothetical protein [Lederbergia galactosidilytica]